MASSGDLSEKEVKNFIKGILISTPQVSTLQSLQRDYRELIGQNIPFHKLKYNSLEHFLRSNPDVCTVNGSGLFAQVYPVIDEKIAHMNKLVTNQRISTKSKRKPLNPRRYNAPVQTRRYNAPRLGFNYSISPYNSSSSASSGSYGYNTAPSNKESQMGVSQNGSQPFQAKNVSVASNAMSYTDVMVKREQNKIGSQLVKQKLENLLINQGKSGNGEAGAQLSKSNTDTRNNLNNNQISEKPENVIDGKEKAHLQHNNTTSHTTDVSEDEDISNVPTRVQSSLKTLINLYEDGIWVSALPTEYRKLFKKDLSFMDYGYTSLIEMCISLKHIFHYVRPGTDDFKLYNRSKPLPASAEKKYTIASYDVGEKVNQEEALPELSWSDFEGFIPEDIFQCGNVIPNQFLPEDTKIDTVLDIVVVEIYDPSKFWCYLGTTDVPAVLDKLMDELQNFYTKPENAKEYAIPPGALKEGLYCVQVIYGEYHRARIVRMYPECKEYVRVLYIDFGTVAKAPVEGMCFLHSSFATLPAQAIRCRLANIVPLRKGHSWPRTASERFREMVNRRDTKIKISYIDWSEEFVCVFLADVTDSENIFYINEMLVKEGHAVWDGEKQVCPFVMSKFKCKVQNIHLFPTFLELEYGLAPSATEMYALAEMLVPLHLCIPQYFTLNEQVSSDDDSTDEMESSFIETVKNHRKFTPLQKIDTRTLITAPPIDLSVFGDLKDEVDQFCHRHGLITSAQEKKEDCPPDEKQMSNCGNKVDCVDGNRTAATNIEDFEPVRMLREDRELSESIIKKLENYCILDSETATKSDNKHDFSTRESSHDYLDVYEKYLTPEEIVEHELATIFEQSENELDSPRFRLNIKKEDTESDINIFDNPEAFENTFSGSSTSGSPVSPLSFLQNIQFKINNYKEIDESYSSRSSSSRTTETNQATKNPFKSEGSPGLDLLKSHFSGQTSTDINRISCSDSAQNTLKAYPLKDKGFHASYLGKATSSRLETFYGERNENQKGDECDDNIDLPFFKSAGGETRNAFVNSLSITNPFRQYLSDKEELNIPLDSSSDDSMINLKCHHDDKNINRLKSPKIKEVAVQTSKCNNSLENTENANQTGSTRKTIADTSCVQSSNASAPKMSIHAAPFTPINYSYPQWSNGGGYPVPYYPQWSDGSNYPAPYPVPYTMPNPRVRPPPGFTNSYQAIPQNTNQLNPYYVMPCTGAPVFSQYRGPPGYYGPPRQMAPPPPGIGNSFSMQDKDFYERFNEFLTNKYKGQT